MKTSLLKSRLRQIQTSGQFRPVLHGTLLILVLIAIVAGFFFIREWKHEALLRKKYVHTSVKTKNEAQPMPLDFRDYSPAFPKGDIFRALHGTQVFDGLPFDINGKFIFDRQGDNNTNHILSLDKIPIKRRFDELHLLHAAEWQTAPGVTIAIIRLNYDDGTKYEFPIQFAVHVLDWFRLPSEETEVITDPNTKICWRHEPVYFGASVRLFKTVLMNPHPFKVVDSMDVVSTQSEANYVLLAATVAKSDPARTVTPTPPDPTGDIRHFDGKVVIHVVDSAGQPIEGAWLIPGMQVKGSGVVAPIVLTSQTGDGTIPYPTGSTKYIFVSIRKDGYQGVSENWQAGQIPDSVTNQLSAPN